MMSVMDWNEKYQKVDLQAVMDAILPFFLPSTNVAIRQYANGIQIFTSEYRIETDRLIGINLALYGTHNGMDVSSFCIYDGIDGYHICLEGSVYRLLPKYCDVQNFIEKKSLILKYEPDE